MFDYAYTSHVHTTSSLGFLRKLKILKVEFLIARESTSIFKRYKGYKLFMFKMLYKLGYSKIDLLICQTDYMKKQLVESLMWLPEKIAIEVIGNPVNFNRISVKVKDCKEKIDLESPFIVSAGRLINEKGFDILISSFKNIKLKHPDYKLVILGEGNLRDKLQKKIISYNLENHIKLLGFVGNVYPYFKYSDLCVVSSRIEGFPNVLLQMMSQNTKIVSTKCAGGIEEIPGIFIAETNDEKSLEQAMELALHHNTTANREIFDDFLNERAIHNFINKIELYLCENKYV
jgi:glycosyltransferase involved in cell wall biosynthesis